MTDRSDCNCDQALALKEAGAALIRKLAAMNEPLNAMCTMGHIHGMPYSGPSWTEEYNALAALVGEPPQPA